MVMSMVAAGGLGAAVLAGCGGSAGHSAALRAPVSAGAPSGASSPGPSSLGTHPLGTPSPGASSASGTSLGQAVTPLAPQIIRTGDVRLRVGAGKLTRAFEDVSGLATGHGGFVASSDLSPGGPDPSGQLVLRVANAQVGAVLAGLHHLGTVTAESIQGTDATGQVVDLAAQLTTLRSEEVAVRTLLGRAQNIGDILTIQNQLFSLQTQVQQLTGQQRTLADQVTYATISVELTTATTPAAPSGTLARAWALAGHHVVAVARGLLLAAGWAAPLVVLGGIAGGSWWVLRRRRHPDPT